MAIKKSFNRANRPSMNILVLAGFAVAVTLYAQENEPPRSRGQDRVTVATETRPANGQSDVLPPEDRQRVEEAVQRAIRWLAAQQEQDGSFPTIDMGEPGVTSICLLAFMAHGHNPSEGQYGERLERAIDFVLTCQKENGLIAVRAPEGPQITRRVQHEVGQTTVYNHAIAALALAEVYGMGQSKRAEQIEKVINKALAATLEMQRWPKQRGAIDEGGWRYVDRFTLDDSDLSITSWQLMFLRSARNAGFNVPEKSISDAVAYVQRCFSEEYGAHGYVTGPGDHRSRAMGGAGILALAHAGYHNSSEAKRTGEWLLQFTFEEYNSDDGLARDRYHYSLFNCCQGMYQLGSPYYEQFFPTAVRNVLKHQRPEGSWDLENFDLDKPFGNSYTTALVLLALAAPNEILPIFQR
jgi:hypothetical protein